MHLPTGRRLLVVLVVVLFAAASAFLLIPGAPGTYTGGVPSHFSVNGRTFLFTGFALTQAQREAGLMNQRVTNSTFMLFLFPYSSEWQFWMYDTNTSLDMIWVSGTNASGSVVHVVHSAPPCYNSIFCLKYSPPSPANFVIEAKSGFALANGVVAGSSIGFS